MATKQPNNIRQWLFQLSLLTRHNFTQEALELNINQNAGVLHHQFPNWAFNDKSLAHAARNCPQFPVYAEICQHLEDWCKSNAPTKRISPPSAKTETQQRAERDAELLRDWDDANGILAKVNQYRNDQFALRLLAAVVSKWAPQHRHLVPVNEGISAADALAAQLKAVTGATA